MFSKSIKLFKIFDIQVEVHPSWFIIFLLIAWTLATAYFPYAYKGLSTLTYWIMGIITAILIFVSVVLHELSHSIVAKKNGLPIRKITLFIFGGVAHMSTEAPNAKTEFKMAIAGPICSLTLCAIFWIGGYLINQFNMWIPIYPVVERLAIVNGVLAGFNLVPGFPLDGGRVLRAIIWNYTNNLKKATLIVSRIGKGFAFFLVGVGFLSMLFAGDFIGGLWLIFIGFFLHQAASMGYRQVSLKSALSGVLVKDIMKKEVISVDENITLEELVNECFFKYRYRSFPVVTDGKVVGNITLNRLKQIEKERWPEIKVKEVMNKDIEPITAYPSQEAFTVLSKIMQEEGGIILVINEEKELIGVLTHRDVMQVLRLKTDLGMGI